MKNYSGICFDLYRTAKEINIVINCACKYMYTKKAFLAYILYVYAIYNIHVYFLPVYFFVLLQFFN